MLDESIECADAKGGHRERDKSRIGGPGAQRGESVGLVAGIKATQRQGDEGECGSHGEMRSTILLTNALLECVGRNGEEVSSMALVVAVTWKQMSRGLMSLE